jgi:hypothetical protein
MSNSVIEIDIDEDDEKLYFKRFFCTLDHVLRVFERDVDRVLTQQR